MVDIQVKNLTKFFVIGENLLEDLSFEIQEGECVVFQRGVNRIGFHGVGKRNRSGGDAAVILCSQQKSRYIVSLRGQCQGEALAGQDGFRGRRYGKKICRFCPDRKDREYQQKQKESEPERKGPQYIRIPYGFGHIRFLLLSCSCGA